MLRSEAVTRIQRGLGFRGDLDAEIVSALQEAQRLLEKGRTLPKFLLQEDQTLTATSGSGEISLPDRFLREFVQEPLRYENTSVSPNTVSFLEKKSLEEARRLYIGADPGTPKVYVIRKSTIAIYPARDTEYSLTWSYFQGAVVLSSDVENAWLAEITGNPEALIGRAGMILAEDVKDPDALTKFTRMYNIAWGGGLAEDIMDEEENNPVRVGSRL